MPPAPPKPWIETPCIYSAPLSHAAGCNIYLKLDSLQPSGSFKSRGVGNLMFRAVEASPSQTVHFYCSSGGNAGLACATSAIALECKATIVVPLTTPPRMVAKLRDLGADVLQIGENWAAADRHLREDLLAKHDPQSRGIYVPPFNHPDIWAGVATMVEELDVQMQEGYGGKGIDGIVCNVGGGGLLSGIMEGVERIKQRSGGRIAPQVLAMETQGADSLNVSVKSGEIVTLPEIASIATSLGAPRVADRAFEWTQRCPEDLISAVVTDAEAVMGCVKFLDDARMLVEVACGATIATAYNGDLRKYLGKGLTDDEWAKRNIVLVVCGGSNINLAMLASYKTKYGI